MKLTAHKLSFAYPASERNALDGLSFAVGAGEYVAVLGANGSGKSTLARCVAGLLSPTAGTVTLEKGDGATVPVALVFQSPSDQIVAETVELDVAFGPENLGLRQDLMRARVSSSLSSFNLANLVRASTASLSSGQKQHLSLAGALALDPALLVLDEPTSMLALTDRVSVMAFLDRFHSSGGTILHVTHDLSEASRAGRILVLEDGRLVFDGTPADLASLSMEDLEKWGLYGEIPSPRKRPARPEASDGAEITAIAATVRAAGALAGFTLSARKGTVTGIVGGAGIGKSFLLEILAGLRDPKDGSVRLGPGETVALAVQESEASLFAEFVADDVAFGPRNAGLSGEALVSRVRSAMDLAGLPFDRFADRQTFSLSGGERRKAALAGIIAMDASVVLLDEPSSALDTRSRSQLLRLILRLRDSGKTVIFTTNRPEECAIADAVIDLDAVRPRGVEEGDGPRRAAELGAEPQTPEGEKGGKAEADRKALDRLRRGAAGSWADLDTPIHRLPPLFKYVHAACAIGAALAVQGWPWLSLVIALECVPVLLARFPLARLAKGILGILPWLAVLCAIQYLFAPNLILSLEFTLRFIALYVPLTLFAYAASHTEIMYGMEDSLRWLAPFRVPVRDISLIAGIVFRFIPLLYEEALRIATARVVRGAGSGGKKGLTAKIAATASLFVPLVLRTLSRAERLAEAVTARYYGTGKNSRYLHWKIGLAQTILIVAVPVLTCLLILASLYFRNR